MMSDMSDTWMNGIWTMTLWSQAKHFLLLRSQEFGHFLVYKISKHIISDKNSQLT